MDKNFIDKFIGLCNKLLEVGQEINSRRKKVKDLDKPKEQIAKLLESRFNIKYEVIISFSDLILATMPPVSSMGSSITYLNYKELIQFYNNENLEDLLKNNDKVLKDDEGYYLDYKNKEIIYKGKNKLKAIIYVNPMKLSLIGFNGRELAAALLHEVGHDFEFIRYNSYFSRKAEHLLDDISKALNEENTLDKIVEVIVKNTGDKVDVSELDLKDKIEIIVDAPSKLFKISEEEYFTRFNMSDPAAVGKEFETMADKFVTDFGLAHFLPPALNKMMAFYNSSAKSYAHTLEPYLFKLTAITMLKQTRNSFISGFIAYYAIIIFFYFIYKPIFEQVFGNLDNNTKEIIAVLIEAFSRLMLIRNYLIIIEEILTMSLTPCTTVTMIFGIVGVINNYYTNYKESGGVNIFPYENDYDRIDSIKRNIIGKLKEVKDPEVKKEFLEQIKQIDKETEKMKRILGNVKTLSIIPTLVPVVDMFRDPNSLNPIYILNKTIRQHINNELYVQSAKIELDIGGK